MAVRSATDRSELANLLAADRFYAAYAISVLEETAFNRSEWSIAEGPLAEGPLTEEPTAKGSDPTPVGALGETATARAVGVVYRGYQPNFGFLMGPAKLVDALLAEGLRPYQAYFACRPSHLDALRAYYRTGAEEPMIRMRVTAETFRPAPGSAQWAVKLDPRQVSVVNRLYARGVGSILTRALMEQGLYYGIFAGSELVAVAGTHFIAPTYGLAAVGNVFTHPGHRGRGLATACTGAVTEALLRRCPDVVLNVNATNEPARRAYRRLGYADHCPFIEVFGTRREGSPLRTWISRVFGAE